MSNVDKAHGLMNATHTALGEKAAREYLWGFWPGLRHAIETGDEQKFSDVHGFMMDTLDDVMDKLFFTSKAYRAEAEDAIEALRQMSM